jgi:ankyrin repeat protein
MNTVYRYFKIWALMLLSAQVIVGMDADMAGEVLYNAVRLNNIDKVREAIQAGANVNWRDQDGRTALMWAVMNDQPVEIVNALIAAGADVNVQDQDGATALMWAVMDDRSIEIVNALLPAADVNAQDQFGRTALMWAVRFNRPLEIVNALIAAGADVNVQEQGGKTPLTKAKENIHTLMNLLQALCDNNKLYDQLYAISEDQSAVIAEVESIMQQVEQQAVESEQKQTILQELQGFLDSYSHGLK